MNGLNGELALAQLHSPVLSAHISRTAGNIETPALKFPRAANTTSSPMSGIDYSKPMLDLAPKVVTLTERDGIVWADPGSVETFTSAFTSSGLFEDSSLIVEIGTMVEVIEISNLEPTTSTEGKGLESIIPQSFRTTSSIKETSSTVSPVQIAQTEDNTLMFEGVGLIETFVNSEISSNMITLTAFKTILVTTVSTSMICTCDTPLSPLPSATFTNSSRPGSSALSKFSPPTIQPSTIYSNSIQTVSTPLPSKSSSLSSTSTAISTSSFLSSMSTLATSIVQLSTSSTESTSSPYSTTTDSQVSAAPSDPPSSTVIPVSPPANPVCNPAPTSRYFDVNPDDVNRHVKNFCKTDFTQDCLINGYTSQNSSCLEASVVGYNISIIPIPFCSSPSTATCEYPLPNVDCNCSYNLHGAWRNCTGNRGMGGSITAGCLVYDLSPIAYCQGS